MCQIVHITILLKNILGLVTAAINKMLFFWLVFRIVYCKNKLQAKKRSIEAFTNTMEKVKAP